MRTPVLWPVSFLIKLQACKKRLRLMRFPVNLDNFLTATYIDSTMQRKPLKYSVKLHDDKQKYYRGLPPAILASLRAGYTLYFLQETLRAYDIRGYKGQNSGDTRCRDFLILESRCRSFSVLESR